MPGLQPDFAEILQTNLGYNMHESNYITAIHKLIPLELEKWKINDSYTSGVADTYYSGDKADIWIEYKLVRNNPNKYTPKLSPLQKAWLARQYARGRKVAVIVGVKGGRGIIIEDLNWEKQCDMTQTLTKREIAAWIIGQCS